MPAVTPVRIAASNAEDARRFIRLLKQLRIRGLQSQWCNIEHLTACDEHPLLIVHRSTCLKPEPRFPALITNRRVLVFSDCRDEHVIAQTLNAGVRHYSSLDDSDRVIQSRLEASLRLPIDRLPQRLNVFPFVFYPLQQRVTIDGSAVALTRREFGLAYFYFCHRERVVSRSELMRSVWSLPESADTRRIDTSTCQVRRKLRLNGENGWSIRNVHRIGYLLQANQNQPVQTPTLSKRPLNV